MTLWNSSENLIQISNHSQILSTFLIMHRNSLKSLMLYALKALRITIQNPSVFYGLNTMCAILFYCEKKSNLHPSPYKTYIWIFKKCMMPHTTMFYITELGKLQSIALHFTVLFLIVGLFFSIFVTVY